MNKILINYYILKDSLKKSRVQIQTLKNQSQQKIMPQQTDKGSLSSVTRIKSKVKVVFLGQQSTGKTSILMRFMNGKFQQSQGATVGIDFMGKNFTVNNHPLRLQLWDTAGQQRFRSLIPSYLKDAMITMIVFDLTNDRSLQNISEWVDLCQHNRNQKNIIVFLGNKQDLVQIRQITEEMIQEKLGKYGKKYFEVSAKTGYNIQEIFNYACQQFIKLNSIESEITFTAINDQMKKRFGNMSAENNHSTISNQGQKGHEKEKQKHGEKGKEKYSQKSIQKQKQNITIRKPNVTQQKKKKKKGCC